EKVVEFSGGTLLVKALRNMEPLRAYAMIYRPAAGEDKEAEKVTDGWVEVQGTTFNFAPGTYDLIVENQEDPARPTMNFQGLSIEEGKVLEKVADFSGGGLRVSALRNGQPFSATLYVDRADQGAGKNKERVVNDYTGKDGKTYKLAPGVYDVTVVNTEDAGRPTLKFPGVTIEAGQSVEKMADFSGGGLRVSALRNGKPFSATVFVDRAVQGTEKNKERVVNDHTGVDGRTFKLVPGVYDVTVVNTEDAGRPTLKFLGVSIETGQTIEKVADFSGGGLRVSVLRNGKPFSATVFVDRPGQGAEKNKERVVNDHTGVDGRTFKLAPGVYDVTVINTEDAGRPTLSFPALTIESGSTVEKVADFSGGALRVSALRNGKPFSATLFVDKAGPGMNQKKERVVNDHTGTDGRTYKLAPGVYDVTVINTEDAGRPILSFTAVTVEAGQTVEKTAEFTGGALRVSAFRGGKPFSARLYVEKADDGTGKKKENVVNDYTGADGKVYKLPPGVYDVTVTNHGDPKQPNLKFPGIRIEAGETVVKVAEF
ncbi:MAG TPA: hypothetical protein DEO88_07050, partial [Syntrophobacteraceae bacterium]|nr:hypothetical protein [Syntrophobacteraceae bacterium]